MRAPISVVIPTLNGEHDLPHALSALGEGLQAGLIREVIFADGGSVDGTLALGDQAGARVVPGAPGRGGQLRAGCAAAQGDWLLILHADTALGEGWAEAALNHLSDQGRAGYFKLRFRARGIAPRLVAGWANLRAGVFGLPYGDQGLLISRHLYDRVGGFAPIPLMEDVAMARALRGCLVGLNACAHTGAARYQRDGWLRRGAGNLLTLARYFLGADPAKLARAYHRR